MNRYEVLRRGTLEKAAAMAQANHYSSVTTGGLANEYAVPEGHVREELRGLAEGLIALFAWDGERDRSYNEYPDADSFF